MNFVTLIRLLLAPGPWGRLYLLALAASTTATAWAWAVVVMHR
jgi:hypothetical protein